MDFTLAFYVVMSFATGFCAGGGVLITLDRWRLHKKIMQELPNHPEYKIYKDIIDGQIPKKEKVEEE
jgi:hypothetical protein